MDSRGKETKGTLEVNNQNEAIGRLKEMGYFPTKVTEAEKGKDGKVDKKGKAAGKAEGKKKGKAINIRIPGLGGKVKSKSLTTFTRQLATLVDAGLPLLRGLRVLERQERNATLKEIIGKLVSRLKAAAPFPRRWRNIPKFLTSCTSTWSRRANSVACSKLCFSAWPSSWKRPRRSRARSSPPCFIP